MGILNTTPRDWSTAAGGASAWNFNAEVRDAFTALQGAWTSYTPYLQGMTTHPSWSGTGGIRQGMYMRIGKTIFGRCFLRLPSTFSNGTGNYYLTMPVVPNYQGAAGVPYVCGTGYCRDASTGPTLWSLTARTFDTVRMVIYVPSTSPAGSYSVGPTAPMTWAAGDELGLSFIYEAA